jgi:cytochrome c556
MKTTSLRPALIVFGIAAMALTFVATDFGNARAQDETKPKKPALELTMRSKLDAAAKVLEGLAVEDKALVHEGAAVLTELSKAEMWQVLKSPEYRHHTQSFRNAVKSLDEAAQKGEFAAAQLEWLDVSKRCFDCHNEIRKAKAPAAK